MSSKQRLQELRITRQSATRHRSVAGGTVVGDYVDPTTGERVLTIKTVAVARPAAAVRKVKGNAKGAGAAVDFPGAGVASGT